MSNQKKIVSWKAKLQLKLLWGYLKGEMAREVVTLLGTCISGY